MGADTLPHIEQIEVAEELAHEELAYEGLAHGELAHGELAHEELAHEELACEGLAHEELACEGLAYKDAKKLTASIAMLVILVSLGMLFTTLLLGYSAYRLTTPVWPPMGMEKVSLFYPSISTLFILLSSLFFILFERGFKKNQKNVACWLGATIFLGVAFMVSQFSLWSSMKNDGYYVETGIFTSLIYAFTWIHAAHVIVGVLLLVAIVPYVLKLDSKHENKVENVGKYWHFLGIVWGVIYLAVFVF